MALLEAHESEDEGYQKTCDLLAQQPDLSGIYVSTVNCLPVCRALRKYRLAGAVTLITSDLFPQMVPHLQQGTIRASIYQNPYLQGQVAMRILMDHFLNRSVIPASSYIGPALVLRSNVHLFREVQDEVQPMAQAI